MVFPLSILRQKAQDASVHLPALKSAAEKIAVQILHGEHGQKKAGGHEKFWQFREYSYADRPQDIDWRQSAKADHVYVREKELQTPQSVYFWANLSASMDFQSAGAVHSKKEAARILSLALAMLFMRGNERIGFLGQNHVGHSDDALDGLGRALLEDNQNTHPSGKVPSKSLLVLCGDFLSSLEEIETAIAPLAGRNTHGILIQTLDPAERDLPYDGHLVFEDGDIQNYKIDNVASIRGAYQDNIRSHILDVKELCDSLGWAHYVHFTDQPLDIILHRIWEGEQR